MPAFYDDVLDRDESADGCTGSPWCECHECERINPLADVEPFDCGDVGTPF